MTEKTPTLRDVKLRELHNDAVVYAQLWTETQKAEYETKWRKAETIFTEALRAALAAEEEGVPLPMILHCPTCGTQHIDAPSPGWANPPHKSHLCACCATVWRPADTETTGVARIETIGRCDTWFPPAPTASP